MMKSETLTRLFNIILLQTNLAKRRVTKKKNERKMLRPKTLTKINDKVDAFAVS